MLALSKIDPEYKAAINGVLLGLIAESHNYGEMTPRLVDALYFIAGVAIEEKFPEHPRKDDMIAEAMLVFCRTWYRFNGDKSQNPLSCFYISAYSAGLCWLNKERKQCTVRELLVLQEEQPDEETEEGCVPD